MSLHLPGLPPGASVSVWRWEGAAGVVFDVHRCPPAYRDRILAGCRARVLGGPVRLVDVQVLLEVAGSVRFQANIQR